jgi:hypothetical protein
LPTWTSFVTRLVYGWSGVDSSRKDHRSNHGRNIHDLRFAFGCTCSVPFRTQKLHGKYFEGARDSTGTADHLQNIIWTTLFGSLERGYSLWWALSQSMTRKALHLLCFVAFEFLLLSSSQRTPTFVPTEMLIFDSDYYIGWSEVPLSLIKSITSTTSVTNFIP